MLTMEDDEVDLARFLSCLSSSVITQEAFIPAFASVVNKVRHHSPKLFNWLTQSGWFYKNLKGQLCDFIWPHLHTLFVSTELTWLARPQTHLARSSLGAEVGGVVACKLLLFATKNNWPENQSRAMKGNNSSSYAIDCHVGWCNYSCHVTIAFSFVCRVDVCIWGSYILQTLRCCKKIYVSHSCQKLATVIALIAHCSWQINFIL